MINLLEKFKNYIYQKLLYITNNEKTSKDEIIFDICGFLIATLFLILGIIGFIIAKEVVWISMLVIEYCWYMDNLRHNR